MFYLGLYDYLYQRENIALCQFVDPKILSSLIIFSYKVSDMNTLVDSL